MRDQVLMDLVDLAAKDAEFRAEARRDPEAALKSRGFELTDDEMAAIKEFQKDTAGLSDAELDEQLVGAGRQGIDAMGC